MGREDVSHLINEFFEKIRSRILLVQDNKDTGR